MPLLTEDITLYIVGYNRSLFYQKRTFRRDEENKEFGVASYALIKYPTEDYLDWLIDISYAWIGKPGNE